MSSKILFVDDEPDIEPLIRQLYRRELRAGEMDLVFEASGVEALELLIVDKDIAAVFTDINMPRMDGLTLLREIQKLPREIPVVMVSAYGDMRNIRSAMNLGAFDFVTKPVDFTDLEATREKLMLRVEEIAERLEAEESAPTPVGPDTVGRDGTVAGSEDVGGADGPASSIEVAAGIAHEIRNPLNFILNFSTLSGRLIDELREEFAAAGETLGPGQARQIEDVLDLVADNLDKIGQHGIRAESIVSSMLSRAKGTAGTKEPTDIHVLLDTQLALAGESARFKEPDLDVTVSRRYTPDMPEVVIDTLSAARALLIVLNNAYDALVDKRGSQNDSYHPELSVTTALRPDAVEIRIRDNGTGIAEADLARIFLPRFSTKHEKRGVGLGLALSYDVVVTQHHGDLFVESREGEFAEFVIVFPLAERSD